MSVTTAYAGARPMIDLHTAGLVVGAELVRARRAGLRGFDAEMSVLRTCPLAQGFAGYHDVTETRV